ncbi:hypothetical protein [Massilioclostridium coli]|uniref:hypothetical protein n=1 Tax=Massilioclostridium coli TaxID=1870991 RepID=UPI00085BBADB|nr:hypothetical protein [Massilioclostridium coli]
MELNKLLNKNLEVYGFESFKGLQKLSNSKGEKAILSTLSPAIMLGMGINEYYAPVLPRGTVFSKTQQIIDADLVVNLVHVEYAPEINKNDSVVIASRHQGTVDILSTMYPNHIILDTVTIGDIQGKKVVGTLPPALIQYAAAYVAVTIKGFDYTKDGDLAGSELKNRLEVSKPIKTTIK